MSDPWGYQRAMEREEDALTEERNRGEISEAEYWQGIRELQRDYEAAAQQAADEEYERWFLTR